VTWILEGTLPHLNLPCKFGDDITLFLVVSFLPWLCTLCSYMDSKCHLHKLSRPLSVPCFFLVQCPKTNWHNPLCIETPMNLCACKPLHPLGLTCLNLGCTPHANFLHSLWCTPCLGKPLGMFMHPRRPLSQLVLLFGVEETLNFVSLRTWVRISTPF
jgi:hypothetical protein